MRLFLWNPVRSNPVRSKSSRSLFTGLLGFALSGGLLSPLAQAQVPAQAPAAAAAPAASAASQPNLRERIRERLARRRAPDVEPVPGPALAFSAGTQTLNFRQDGLDRKVLVHVPTGYDPARPAPLVIALHGGGGHAEHMAQNYGLVEKADREGFVVAFPNGYSRRAGGRLATWNAGECCGDARDRKVDDVAFIRAAVERVAQHVRIDRTRVFAAGMSNGGMLAHRLACEASDLFRAVASVAGPDATTTCTPARPISVLHIHARDDTHVLFAGGAGDDAFRDASKVMDFVSVPETITRWAKRGQCTAQPRLTLQRPGATCQTYTGCQGGMTVRLCVTDDGGHSWPGAEASRLGKATPSKALNANDVIWDFFSTSR